MSADSIVVELTLEPGSRDSLIHAHWFRVSRRRRITGLVVWVLLVPCTTNLLADWQSFPLRENGTIPVWTVAGPFPNGKPLAHGPGCFGYYKDYLEAVGGEGHCIPAQGDAVPYDGGKRMVWRTTFTNATGLLDYLDAFGVDRETPGAAYAFCRIDSPTARTVALKVRSNDGVRVWLNDDLIHEHHVGRTIDDGGEDRVLGRLKCGSNRLLIKVDQSGGAWAHRLAITGPKDESIDDLAIAINAVDPVRGKIRSANFSTSCLITKSPQGERQVIVAQIVSGGLKDVTCRISKPEWLDTHVIQIGDLPIGRHRVELLIPVISKSGPARVVLESSTDRTELRDVHLHKTRKWTIYLVQHTHTDIGYTRPPDELLPAFLRHIDYALDYCDVTDDYPDDAKFRWTCEASWVVREYLRRRPPEQIERLRKRVAEGRIEITAMFLNMVELADENIMAASLTPIREFRQHGLSVSTAMQNDVPGASWCLVDYFSDIDIRYLVMGVNNDRTPRPFEKPTAFWWESPSGKRLLAWRPDHYHTGNHLGIHTGRLSTMERRTLKYLEFLEERGYPFDRIGLQYSGMQIDNSPPAIAECDLIRQWNEKYAWPKLRSALAREFPEYIEQHHAEALPVYRGAWPNWWNDGIAFAHVETGEARRTHADLLVAQGLLSVAALLGVEIPASAIDEIRSVRDDLLFYDEHTYGAQEEFTHPMAENTIVQLNEKVSHLWEAVKHCALLRETAFGLLQSHVNRAAKPTVAIFNTLSWPRSGRVEVYIGHELLPLDRQFRMVDGVTGRAVPVRIARSRFEGSYWTLWVHDVPPMGWKVIRIEVGDGKASPAPATESEGNVLENRFYKVVVDPESGSLTSLVDKELGRDFVDHDSQWGFGEFIYDTLTDNHFFDRESFLERSTRSSLRNVRVSLRDQGPIWKSLTISADADGCITTEEKPGVQCEVRLYEPEKRIEFHFQMRKQYVNQPEAIYVAFPFALQDGVILYDAQGGLVTPGVNQIPGSSADWHTVQSFVSVRDQEGQVIFGSDEVPLVQFGDINMGKWQYIAKIDKPQVFSYVVNNYWTYGLRGTKESEFSWSYYLTSTRDTGNTPAARMGWASRIPLVARVFPAGPTPGGATSLSTLNVNTPNVLMVSVQPAREGDGILLLLREVDGRRTEVEFAKLRNRVKRIDIVNVLEGIIEKGSTKVVLDPVEVKFVKLVF